LELSTEGFLGIRNMMELLLSAIIELWLLRPCAHGVTILRQQLETSCVCNKFETETKLLSAHGCTDEGLDVNQ
jgi:hypothetical protein